MFREKTAPSFCRGRNGAVPVFSKSYAKRRKAFKIEEISIYKGEKKMKYKDWLCAWLKLYVKPTTKTRTYEKYADTVRLHVAPYLGERELGELTGIALQRYVVGLSERGNKKSGQGLSPSTVNGIVTLVQRSLRCAVSAGMASTQAANEIRRPKMFPKKTACFTFSEQKKIERYILQGKKSVLYGILFCFYSGLRIGELLALTWEDIDFGRRILTVKKTCRDTYVGGKYVKAFSTPKTASSAREIPLPERLLSLLNGIRRNGRGKFVVSRGGEGVSVRSYQKTFELLLRKLNIPRRGFHAIRHTFATRALEVGMDVKTLSEILGHKNSAITLNCYAHSFLEHKSAMMAKMSRALP